MHISILWILYLDEEKLVKTTESQSDVALKYFDHWSKKEYEASARYLDEHLSFTGPIDKFNNAHDYVESIRRLAQIVTGVHRRKTFVEGNDVCFVYDLATNTTAGTVPCATWIKAENGKFKSIQVFFADIPSGAVVDQKHLHENNIH